jgi:hypothetical protein
VVPFLAPHSASAEAPFDNWLGASGKWVNRMTIEFNNVFFVDSDPSDKVYNFTFTATSNAACKSTIAYNHTNQFGVDQPSPYGDAGTASQAGLRLFVPVPSSTNCDEVSKSTDPARGQGATVTAPCKNQYQYHGQGDWIGCRIGVSDIGARLISFFVDTDGNVKSINPSQAISFVAAANTWNGQTVYIRSDQLNAQCKNLITKVGDQWILFSLKADEKGATNWNQYYDIVKTATGAGALQQDRCSNNPDAFTNVYLAALDGANPTAGGYFNIYVGTTANQGGSKAAVSGSSNAGAGQGTGGNATADIAPTCESSGFSLNWILCPIYNATTSFVDWMMKIVISMLHTDNFLDPDQPIYAVWSQFRIYANIFLVIAVLVAVFGQSIGEGVFQAFMARTFLMRLLYVVFLANVSIYLFAAFFDVVNVVGAGIAAAFTAPLKGAGMFTFTPTTTQQTGIGLAATGAGIAAAAGGILWGGLIGPQAAVMVALFIVLPALVAVISLFATLAFIRVVKWVIIVPSPVFAALYATPWGEKYAKKEVEWAGIIGVASIMLPGLFGLSNLASYLTITAAESPERNILTAKFNSITDMVMAYIIIWLPIALAGGTIAAAGGIIGRTHGFLTNAGKRAHQGILGNENDPNSTRNKARRRFGAAMTQRQSDVLARGDKSTPGWRGSVARARGRIVGSGMFGDVTQRQSTYNAIAAKQRAAKTDTGGDDEIYAGGGYMLRAGERNHKGEEIYKDTYYNAKGGEISENLYNRGKRLHGGNSHEVGESLMYSLGKAQTEEDKSAFRMAFGKNALDQGWSEGEMKGAYAHAAYPHKRNHASVWYSGPEYERSPSGTVTGVRFDDVGNRQVRKKPTDSDHTSYDNMIKDLHQSRGSFDLSGDRHEDFQVMRSWQADLENKVMTGTADDHDRTALGRTYEVFDAVSSRMQMGTDPDGNVTTNGASAAAQQSILDAVAERRLDMTKTDTNGTREFFRVDQAKAATGGTYKLNARPTAPPAGVSTLGKVNTAGGQAADPTTIDPRTGLPFAAQEPRKNMPSVIR